PAAHISLPPEQVEAALARLATSASTVAWCTMPVAVDALRSHASRFPSRPQSPWVMRATSVALPVELTRRELSSGQRRSVASPELGPYPCAAKPAGQDADWLPNLV